MTIDEIEALIRRMSPEQREDAVRLVHSAGIWTPLPGPQTMAYISDADIAVSYTHLTLPTIYSV